MSTFNAKVTLREGMKIAHKDKEDEMFTLLKANTDNEMYLLSGNKILKLSEVENLDEDYICHNLSSFSDEVKVIITEKENWYLVDDEFCANSFVENELDERDDDFTSVDMKIKRMSREAYMSKKNNTYYFKCREIIESRYLDSKKQQ